MIIIACCREAWCIEKTEELFGTVVGSVFVKKMFSAQAKKEVELMVETITEAFTSLVKEASWMDETTKENAVLKAAAMKVLVAHPDWMNNDTYIDQLYEQVIAKTDEKQRQNSMHKFILHRLCRALIAISRIT